MSHLSQVILIYIFIFITYVLTIGFVQKNTNKLSTQIEQQCSVKVYSHE